MDAKLLHEDTHFKVYEHPGELYLCPCFASWDTADVQRLQEATQPLIDDRSPRFIMDLREMEDIGLSARWKTAVWMRNNRHRVVALAVIVRSPSDRVVLSALVRVAGDYNVVAVDTYPEAQAFVERYPPS